MRAFLFLVALCALVAAVHSVPAMENYERPPWAMGEDGDLTPWSNPFSAFGYDMMMCRLGCTRYCLSNGFFKGVCRQQQCFCYGFPKGPNTMMPFN